MVERTGLTVEIHQRRSIDNLLRLRSADPDLPFVPVLQGWALADYERHLEMYAVAGLDLTREPLTAVGSVCRRQASGEIEAIMATLSSQGLRLHGFGVKQAGLTRYADCLTSADSMAWSFTARRDKPLSGCTHKSCTNCLKYALLWRERAIRQLDEVQMRLAV